MKFQPISAEIVGNEIAHELLADIYAGKMSLTDARCWIAELRSEGHARLADEVESRLPRFAH